MIELLENKHLETINPDRRKEFSKHTEISQELNLVEFYFLFPHHPWRRGTNKKFSVGREFSLTNAKYYTTLFSLSLIFNYNSSIWVCSLAISYNKPIVLKS